jgi:ABC-type Fe3+/spermidine/putrescine transport system ATPase subunit
MAVLTIEGLSKIFGSGRLEVRALEDINLSVSPGDLVALLGPSGSGKTTMLLCTSLILEPTQGKIIFDGQTIFQKNGWAGGDPAPPPGEDGLHLSIPQSYSLPHRSAKRPVPFESGGCQR